MKNLHQISAHIGVKIHPAVKAWMYAYREVAEYIWKNRAKELYMYDIYDKKYKKLRIGITTPSEGMTGYLRRYPEFNEPDRIPSNFRVEY